MATLNPGATLLADGTYTATVSGVRDVAGNPLANRTCVFTTRTAL